MVEPLKLAPTKVRIDSTLQDSLFYYRLSSMIFPVCACKMFSSHQASLGHMSVRRGFSPESWRHDGV